MTADSMPDFLNLGTSEYANHTRQIYDAMTPEEQKALAQCVTRLESILKLKEFPRTDVGITMMPREDRTGYRIYVIPRAVEEKERVLGLIEGMGLCSNHPRSVEFRDKIGFPIGSVRFDSVTALAMTLNAATRDQAEKIDIEKGRAVA